MRERLSPVESIMWRAGQDPGLRMTVGTLMILDRAPSVAALEQRLAEAATAVPRLRRRPDDPTGVRGRPAWIDDGDVDPSAHLAVMAVPLPGGRRQLLDLLSLLEPRPFDPERPPWDATLIEGLEGGRAALYLRAHHAVTDGPGSTALVTAVLDREEGLDAPPSGAADEPDGSDEPDAAAAVLGIDSPDEFAAGRRPGTVTLTIDLTRAAGAAREAAGVALDAAASAREVAPVQSVIRAVQRGLDAASSVPGRWWWSEDPCRRCLRHGR